MENFDKTKIQNSIIISNSILGIISLLANLLTIFIFISKPMIRDYIFKLSFFLAISELVNNLAYFLSLNFIKYPDIYNNKIICDLQALLTAYSDCSSLLWILMICYGIYDLFVNRNENYDKGKNKLIIGCFILPVIPAVLYEKI